MEKREKQMKMDSAVDEIRRRFGFYSIQRDSCTGTGFCRQSMQKKNTQYSCYGHTDHGKETGADLLLSAFEILIKYVKKNKQINGFNIKIGSWRIQA